MAEQPGSDVVTTGAQLAQVRVPLQEAGEVLTFADASGRTPIVVVVERPNRINARALLLAGASVALGILGNLISDWTWLALGLVVALGLAGFAVFRSFMVQIPEGANGLLVRKGKHAGIVGPGSHVIPPWIGISHLVTRREIPYDAPIVEAPTRDNVRAWVDSLIMINIADPYRFVFNITAADFDAVLAAFCQDALRRMVRTMTWDQVGDLTQRETDDLRAALDADVEAYGARVSRVTITYARPPADFLLSEEAKQLSVLQRAEHAERHALAQRQQSDEDEIAHQRALARVSREREELQIRVQEAEAKRLVAELEADAIIGRLAKLEEALERFPQAARYDFEGAQLDAVRALATNSRAFVQLGTTDDMGRAFIIRDFVHGALGDSPANGGHNTTPVGQERDAEK